MFALQVTGLSQALAKLQRAGKPSTQRRILRRGMGKATKVVLDAAKARVRKRTGLLRQSLGRKTVTFAESNTVVGIVGPRKGFRRALVRVALKTRTKLKAMKGIKAKEKGLDVLGWIDPLYYAHLVEFGTSKAPAYPFMRAAWNETLGRVKAILAAEVVTGTVKELLK